MPFCDCDRLQLKKVTVIIRDKVIILFTIEFLVWYQDLFSKIDFYLLISKAQRMLLECPKCIFIAGSRKYYRKVDYCLFENPELIVSDHLPQAILIRQWADRHNAMRYRANSWLP